MVLDVAVKGEGMDEGTFAGTFREYGGLEAVWI